MKLYRNSEGRYQVPGQQDRKAERVDIPTDSAGLAAFLNFHVPSNDNRSPAFELGRSDAERGMTTNPYASPDLREQWEAGHAFAVESGAAKLPSFSVVALPRNDRRARRGR